MTTQPINVVDEIMNKIDCEEWEIYMDNKIYNLNNDNLKELLNRNLSNHSNVVEMPEMENMKKLVDNL